MVAGGSNVAQMDVVVSCAGLRASLSGRAPNSVCSGVDDGEDGVYAAFNDVVEWDEPVHLIFKSFAPSNSTPPTTVR